MKLFCFFKWIMSFLTILSIILLLWYFWNNYTATYKNIKVHVPSSIVQYGPGGSGTTLQFQILCVLMALLHEDEINKVGCYYASQPLKQYSVIKTHFIRDNIFQMLPSDSWVFMTSCNKLTGEIKIALENNKRKIKNMKMKIPYIADVEMVSKRGHTIILEYHQFFGLSEIRKEHALEYIRYWDILRICCGKQMSADWRKHLTPSATYKQHHAKNSSSYPACEMYNISEVEKLLIKSYVYQHFAHIPSLQDIIGKPSNVDGTLDGTYCERCNKNVAAKGLHFNDNCE